MFSIDEKNISMVTLDLKKILEDTFEKIICL